MLINSYTDKDCRKSWVDNGDCCCNCIHRYLLVVDNFPMGYYCGVFKDESDDGLIHISRHGHGMCEMHRRKGEKSAKDMTIEIFGEETDTSEHN